MGFQVYSLMADKVWNLDNLIGYVTLVAIAGTTLLVPCLSFKSLQLVWSLVNHRFHLRVTALQIRYRDLTGCQGTRTVILEMAVSWQLTYSIMEIIKRLCFKTQKYLSKWMHEISIQLHCSVLVLPCCQIEYNKWIYTTYFNFNPSCAENSGLSVNMYLHLI